MDEPKPGNEDVRPILIIGEALYFKDETKDDVIISFISSPNSIYGLTWKILESVMSCTTQETL